MRRPCFLIEVITVQCLPDSEPKPRFHVSSKKKKPSQSFATPDRLCGNGSMSMQLSNSIVKALAGGGSAMHELRSLNSFAD